jgi:hypothetical protein
MPSTPGMRELSLLIHSKEVVVSVVYEVVRSRVRRGLEHGIDPEPAEAP